MTIDKPEVTFFIAAEASEPTLTVEIFDGDQARPFDDSAGGATTCYRLSTDRLKDGPSADDVTLVEVLSTSRLLRVRFRPGEHYCGGVFGKRQRSPPQLEISATPQRPLLVSSARPASAWLEDSATISVLLPIDVGESVTELSRALELIRLATDVPPFRGTPDCLWPPKHQYVPFRFGVNLFTDTVGGACVPTGSLRVVNVVSTEPEDDRGDGRTAPDVVFGDGGFCVRAERAGPGKEEITWRTDRGACVDRHGRRRGPQRRRRREYRSRRGLGRNA